MKTEPEQKLEQELAIELEPELKPELRWEEEPSAELELELGSRPNCRVDPQPVLLQLPRGKVTGCFQV